MQCMPLLEETKLEMWTVLDLESNESVKRIQNGFLTILRRYLQEHSKNNVDFKMPNIIWCISALPRVYKMFKTKNTKPEEQIIDKIWSKRYVCPPSFYLWLQCILIQGTTSLLLFLTINELIVSNRSNYASFRLYQASNLNKTLLPSERPLGFIPTKLILTQCIRIQLKLGLSLANAYPNPSIMFRKISSRFCWLF